MNGVPLSAKARWNEVLNWQGTREDLIRADNNPQHNSCQWDLVIFLFFVIVSEELFHSIDTPSRPLISSRIKALTPSRPGQAQPDRSAIRFNVDHKFQKRATELLERDEFAQLYGQIRSTCETKFVAVREFTKFLDAREQVFAGRQVRLPLIGRYRRHVARDW